MTENDTQMIDADSWQVRAAMCELLAFSLRYPDGNTVEAVASGEWADAARELAEALGVALPEDFAAGLPGGSTEGAGEGSEPVDEEALLHALRAEATRLFVGASEPVVSPFEGVWAAQADGVQPLLFVNPKSMEVERFCRACGLGRPEGTNEPLDHIATEWELLQFLALEASGAGVDEAGTVAHEDLPGGSPQAAFDAFWAEHARVWMPLFAGKVIAETRQPFYRSAAQLLAAVVA